MEETFIDETYCLILFNIMGKDEVEHEVEKAEPVDEKKVANYCQNVEDRGIQYLEK